MLSEQINTPDATANRVAWLSRVLRIEWLGQTAASLCWIISVFVYGLSSAGDYLQLCAASCWLIANLAVLMTPQDNPDAAHA